MRNFLRQSAVVMLAVLPVTIDWIAKVMVWPRPFWVQYYDPETIYFYGGLDLLRGRAPANLDNPGVPLHLLSAAIALITGTTPRRYTQFLLVAHVLGFLLTLAAILLLVKVVLKDAPLILRVAGAWTYFLAPQALERLDIWSPEILYFPLGVAIMAFLWKERRASAGFIAGIAIATKWVFLPWIAAIGAAMLVARRFRDAIVASLACMAGFLVTVIAVVPSLRHMFHLVISPNFQSWGLLFATAHGWMFWLVCTVLFAALTLRRRDLPMITFAVVIIALTFLGASLNPSFRYILPAALGVATLFAIASSTGRAPKALQVALGVVAVVLMAKTVRDDIGAHRARVADGELLRAQIEAALPPGVTVVYGWRLPEPSFALRIMAHDPQDLEAIAMDWPRAGHLNPWTRQISLPSGLSRFDYVVVSPADLQSVPRAQVVGKVASYVIGAMP
jgi:hypothetical protein